MKLPWKNQLDKVLNDDNRDGMFGSNIDWDVKEVRRYLSKLEKLGISDIEFPDYDTIKFTLPTWHDTGLVKNYIDILLIVLTEHPRPCDVIHNKKKNQLTLRYDW